MQNTNIILLSFLVAVLTFSFIQYSDAASADDRNVKNFCDRVAPFYDANKSGTLEKYENHPFLKLCSFHSGSQSSSASSSYSTKSSSSSNDYNTNYWAEKSKSKTTSNDYTKATTNYWAEKFVKSTHNFNIPNPIELKKINPIKTPDYIQTFKPINDYKPINNHFYDNQMNNRYSPSHPTNNHFNSNHHQPTFTWSYIPNPFLGER